MYFPAIYKSLFVRLGHIYILKIDAEDISYEYLCFQMLVKPYTLIYNGKVTQIKQALAHHNTTVKQVLIKVNFQSQIASLTLLATREAQPRPQANTY